MHTLYILALNEPSLKPYPGRVQSKRSLLLPCSPHLLCSTYPTSNLLMTNKDPSELCVSELCAVCSITSHTASAPAAAVTGSAASQTSARL